MPEMFSAQQGEIGNVEAQAKTKKHETLQQELQERTTLYNKEVDDAGKIIENAEKNVNTPDAKKKVEGYKTDISGYLSQVAEKGREALAKDPDKSTTEIQSIAQLSSSLKSTVDTAKLYVPMFLDVEHSVNLSAKIAPEMVKAEKIQDAKPPLTRAQKYDIFTDLGNAIQDAMDPLASWRPDAMSPDMQKIFDVAFRPLNEAQATLGDYELDNLSEAEKKDPDLAKLKQSKDLFDGEQPNIKKVGELSDEAMNNMVISNDKREKDIAEMGKLADTALDNLTTALKTYNSIDKKNMNAQMVEYGTYFESLLPKINLQIKEMADVKLYVSTKSTVDGLTDEEKGCLEFGTDGIVRKTEKFKQLSPDKQQALMTKLTNLRLQIALEIDEKTAEESDKPVIEARKKLMDGNWIDAKQQLLSYYKENGSNPEKASRTAEVRGMLHGIAKLEIKQSTERLLAMKASLDTRFNNNPMGKSDTGTWTAQQDQLFVESMSRVLAKAEEMIDSGEVLTMEEAESKLRSMKFTPNTGMSQQAAVDQLDEMKKLSDDAVKEKQKKSLESTQDSIKSLQEAIKHAQERPNDVGLDGNPIGQNLEFMQKNLASYQSQLEAAQKMSPEDYHKFLEGRAEQNLRDAKFRNALAVFQGGFVTDGYGNRADNVYDMFKQQRLLNDPDPVKREANTLKLAKEARDHGLPALSRRLYDQYFQKEIDEQSNNVSRADIEKQFLGNSDNMKKIDKALAQWKDTFKEKTGKDPDQTQIDSARQAMISEMVGSAYSKAIKLKVHESFKGGTSERAKAWNEAYGGKIVVENFGQEGEGVDFKLAMISPTAALGKYVADYQAFYTDEEWNALPAKIGIMTAVTIASMGVAEGVVAVGGVAARTLLGESAIAALTGTVTESGATVGGSFAGRALAWGARTTLKGVAFGTTQGALNYVIQGDKSTFESPKAYFKAMGMSIATLGVLEAVGAGFGKLRQAVAATEMAGMTEEEIAQAAYMPKHIGETSWWTGESTAKNAARLGSRRLRGVPGPIGDAGWWIARTSAEGTALTGLNATEAWLGGQEYGMHEGVKAFGENFLFAAAITGTHEFMGPGVHEAPKTPDVSKETKVGDNFFSTFDRGVPENARKAGIPEGAEGWVDKEGKVHFNIDRLNTGKTTVAGTDGKPVERSIMAEGYKVSINTDGEFTVEGPDGKQMSLHEYEKAMKGTPYERTLLNTMVEIKNHEATHQVLEFGFTKVEVDSEGKPQRVPDTAKTKAFTDLFAKPGPGGNVPEGKIALVDNQGQPMEPTWQNIQEYLCQVGDGSVTVPKAQAEAMQGVIQEEIPGFTFERARNVATKLIAANPVEAFYRDEMAAKHVGKPWKKISSGADFNEALNTEKGQETNYKIAHEILMGYIYVLRTGDPAQIEAFKAGHEVFIDGKVLDTFAANYQKTVDFVTTKMSTIEGLQDLMKLEKSGKMSPSMREVYKRIASEGKMVKDLTSTRKADGTTKTPEEIRNDLAELRQQIEFHGVEVNKFSAKYLTATPEGMKILAEQPGGTDFIREAMRKGEVKDFANFPPEVKAKMRAEAEKVLTDRLTDAEMALQGKIAKAEKEISEKEARGEDTSNDHLKLGNIRDLLKTYQSVELSDPAKIDALLDKVEQQQPPSGYGEMPKLADIFFANSDRLNPDFLANILDGKMKYDTVDGPKGKEKVMFVEGRILGVGGLGEVWSTIEFKAGSNEGHEMVIKRPKNGLDISPNVKAEEALAHSVGDYDLMDESDQHIMIEIFNEFRTKAMKEPGGLERIQREIVAKLPRGQTTNDFFSMVTRMQAAYAESGNARLIMDHQAKGELNTFTKINGVSDSGIIFLESIANPKANYEVCDYEKIMSGEVTSLDGTKPIDQKQFWTGIVDVMHALADANSKGIVHRDIKPENFGVGPDGRIRLIDVGSIKTKNNIHDVGFFEVPKGNPMHYPVPNGVSEMYPNRGGITPGYYSGEIATAEAKGTLAPDGKPKVTFGASDRFAMAVSLEEIVHQQSDPNKPHWASDAQIQQLQGVITYLKGPRADMEVAATRIEGIMGTH